jgi:hypothetical protein
MNKEEGGDRQLLEEGIAYNAEDEMVWDLEEFIT